MSVTSARRRILALKGFYLTSKHQHGGRGIIRDGALEFIPNWLPRAVMFDQMEIGKVYLLDLGSFPVVGELVAKSDAVVTLKNAVRILWDGRHNEFAKGKPPENAEIEETYKEYNVNPDWVIAWAPYAGGKIPKQQ